MASLPMTALPPDEDRSIQISAVMMVGLAIAIVAFALRFFTRWKITKNLGYDDAIIAIALITGIVDASLTQAETIPAGIGRHVIYVSPEDVATSVKWITILTYLSMVSIVAPKYAVVMLLCKIMSPSKPRRWFLWGLVIVLTAIYVVNIVLLSVQCIPLEKFWNPSLPGSCGLFEANLDFGIFTTACSALSDLVLALFPISIVWNLRIKLGRKVGICVVMGLGVLYLILLGAERTTKLIKSSAAIVAVIKATKLGLVNAKSDYTWIIVDLLIWTSLEIHLVIACACLPTLPPLVKLIRDREYRSKTFPSYRKTSAQVDSEGSELHPRSRDYHSGRSEDTQTTWNKGDILRSTQIETSWSAV